MKKVKNQPGLFQQFFNSEKAGGLILIVCTAISLFSPIHRLALISSISGIHSATLQYRWNEQYPFSIEEWINDGLMTIFFLLVGLEIERELYIGELSSIKNAALPHSGRYRGYAGSGTYSFFI